MSERARNAWGLTGLVACMAAAIGLMLGACLGVSKVAVWNPVAGWATGVLAVLAFFWVLGYFADWSDF